jgi:hypothetical protein
MPFGRPTRRGKKSRPRKTPTKQWRSVTNKPCAAPCPHLQPARMPFEKRLQSSDLAVPERQDPMASGEGCGSPVGRTRRRERHRRRAARTLHAKGEYLTAWKTQADGSGKVPFDLFHSDLPQVPSPPPGRRGSAIRMALAFWPKPEAENRKPGYNDPVGSWTGRSLAASSDAGRGKSELRRAVCRITSGRPGSSPSDGKCHRKYTAPVFPDSSSRIGVRVKRCGKSAPPRQ